MPKPISEQVIVITGASSGIGLATAQMAARRGAAVVLAARNAEDLEHYAQQLRQEGARALAVPTDVADFAQVLELARAAVEEFGRIDTWVNNAGIFTYASFREQPLQDFEQVMRVNFLGQVYGAKAALPHLEASAGALVCVGSAYSDRGAPLWSSYCASKHAVKGWFEALRGELMHDQSPVRMTLVKPSAINTPIYAKAKTQRGVKPKGPPPIFEPELVAEEILRAAESDVREIMVGEGAKLMSLGQRVSPRLMDLQMIPVGYVLSRTDEPKTEDAPHNLFEPLAHDGGVHGDLGGQAFRHSLYQEAARRPVLSALAVAAALGAGAVAARGSGRSSLPLLLGAGALMLAGRGALVASHA